MPFIPCSDLNYFPAAKHYLTEIKSSSIDISFWLTYFVVWLIQKGERDYGIDRKTE